MCNLMSIAEFSALSLYLSLTLSVCLSVCLLPLKQNGIATARGINNAKVSHSNLS